MITPVAAPAFAPRLLEWFETGGRHDLPWQHPRTPYRVWLSEVMLQQTQVRTVMPYFERFVAALPDLASLAAASLDQVLALWSGLGYYSRARNLHAAARICVERHGGDLPRDVSALTALPGIGPSTAAAIAAQAWGDRHAILDGNVKRVLARYHGVHGWPGLPAVESTLWAFARTHVADPSLPSNRLADYTQAQMDLGATVCTRKRPACLVCPLRADCVARTQGLTEELPTPRPGRALPLRQAVALALRDRQGRLLLTRRPPVGVWAQLWSLPQFEDEAAACAWLERVRATTSSTRPLPLVDHTFSHFRLHLQPKLLHVASSPAGVGENADSVWVMREDIALLGIPAPIRRLLTAIFED